MISHSDTVQTCTLGIAFIALFVGAISSLQATTGNVLYNTQVSPNIASASSSEGARLATAESTNNMKNESAEADTGWSVGFTSIAFAADKSHNTVLSIDLTKASLPPEEKIGDKTPKEVHKQAQKRAKRSNTSDPVMTQTDKEEILWLARIMYSETKRPSEQRLIGWVVRNRVDTGYTGHTYESVAKHSGQFSGLHPYDNRYEHNMSRWYSSSGHSWQTALDTAKEIYFADDSERPLSLTTRHFYSPHAVTRTPRWAQNREAIKLIKDPSTDRVRFALYDKVR